MIKKFFKEQPLYKVIMDIVFIVIALSGIAVSIYMNVVGRSLWYDEAALAYSFVRRSFSELTATGLDLVQSAPVGWLYAVKILCKIFGYSDFVMRVPSILAYIGCLVLVYYVAKKILKLYYAFAPVAFAASLPLLLQYSNMFKPYISDAFLALLAVVLFYLYKERKLNVYLLGVIWGVMIWFSSPVCFVEGGIIIASFIVSLMSKDKIKIKQDIISLLKIGVIIVVFFLLFKNKERCTSIISSMLCLTALGSESHILLSIFPCFTTKYNNSVRECAWISTPYCLLPVYVIA